MFIFIFFVNIRKSLFSCMCRTTAPPTTPTQTEASRGSTVLTSCGSQVALSRPDFWMHCRKLFFVAQCHLNFLQIPYPYLQILLHRISWTWNRENANIPKMIFKFMNDVVLVLLETVNLFVLAVCVCVCVCMCVGQRAIFRQHHFWRICINCIGGHFTRDSGSSTKWVTQTRL